MPIHSFRFFTKPDSQQESPDGLMACGAYLPVEVHVPDVIAQQLSAGNETIPTPVVGMALIDTGATFSAVHEPVLQVLKMGLRGFMWVDIGISG